MSVSRQTRIEWFERVCRERGLLLTVQRRVVFEILIGRKDHPTADQVCDEIRPRLGGISRTTVYRILETLVGLGLIAKICHPGSAARFDPKVRRHDHLVCMHCEKVIDIEDKRLDGVPWPDVRGQGFEISDYHIHFRGICSACRRKFGKKGASTQEAGKRGAGKPARSQTRRSGRNRRTKP